MGGGRRRPWRASAVASLVSAPIPANTPVISPHVVIRVVTASSMRMGRPSVAPPPSGPRACLLTVIALTARAASISLAALAVSLPAAGSGSSP